MFFICNSFIKGTVPGLMTEEFYNANIEKLKKAETEDSKGLCDIVFQKTTSKEFLKNQSRVLEYEIGNIKLLENYNKEFYRHIFLSGNTGLTIKLFYTSGISQKEFREQNLLFGIDGSTATVFFAEATILLTEENPTVLWEFTPIQPTNIDYVVAEQYY